jgi:hypothetical protein
MCNHLTNKFHIRHEIYANRQGPSIYKRPAKPMAEDSLPRHRAGNWYTRNEEVAALVCYLGMTGSVMDGGEQSGTVELTVGEIIAVILSVFELLLLRYGLR